MTRSLLVALLVATALPAGCSSSGAVSPGRDADVQDTALPETGPAGGSGGGGFGGGGTGGGGTGGGGTGGGGTGGGPLQPTVRTVSAGRDYLVGAFAAPAGIIVVRGGHIEIVSRDGAPLALITTPRENIAASFDGTQLVVADRAMLTAYDTSLAPLGETPVGEPCQSIVAASNRVVCATFYGVYGVRSYVPRPGGAQTRSLAPTSLSRGIGPLVRVPGREQILLLDRGSFDKRLLLYDVSASGIVPDAAGSAGAGLQNTTDLAFDRTPPQRLLADNGRFFRLGPADCITTDPKTCLVPDGALAHRMVQEIVVAAVSDGAGHFQVLRTVSLPTQPYCAGGQGCAFDSINAATGEVERTTMFRLSVSQPVSAAYDPVSDAMVLGYRSPDGDRVSLLDFTPRTPPAGPAPDPDAGPAPVPPPPDSPLSGCVPGRRLIDGQTRVLTAAPVPGGVILAMDSGLFRMDRAGNVLKTVTRAQPPASAVFDAGMLVIGDAKGLAFYDQSLLLLREIPVDGGCQTVAMLSTGRAVCDTRDPIYNAVSTVRTFAVDSGALLATRGQDAMVPAGSHLKRVPGVEALVTRSWNDPVYLLYGAAPDGAVSFVNSSLWQNFVPGLPFGLWGSGRAGALPVHLISWSGSLLKIYAPDCLSTGATFEAGCFVPDGEIGTQRGDQRFVAMVSDGPNDLFTITMDDARNFFPPSDRCADNCVLAQHIDIPSRRVISSRMSSVPLEDVITMAHDAECGMLLVATFDNGLDEMGSGADYHVDLLDYGGP